MQYLRCLLPYASKVAPQPAQVWVVMARRSSIIGWVCHQDMRQDRLQNLCPRRGWSMAFPQCSQTPSMGVRLGCGVMLLRLHHDLIVSRPTPVIAATFPKRDDLSLHAWLHGLFTVLSPMRPCPRRKPDKTRCLHGQRGAATL